MLIDLCKLCIRNMYALLYGEYVLIIDFWALYVSIFFYCSFWASLYNVFWNWMHNWYQLTSYISFVRVRIQYICIDLDRSIREISTSSHNKMFKVDLLGPVDPITFFLSRTYTGFSYGPPHKRHTHTLCPFHCFAHTHTHIHTHHVTSQLIEICYNKEDIYCEGFFTLQQYKWFLFVIGFQSTTDQLYPVVYS
jgi:hypothetical protein